MVVPDHQSVDEQEDCRCGRFGEDRAEGVFQGDPGQTDGDGGDHDHPGQAFVPALDTEPSVTQATRQAAHEPSDDAHPVGPEEPQEGQRGSAVEGHDVGQVERFLAAGLGGLSDQGVPGSADPGRDQD
jgi:hypothetical protein